MFKINKLINFILFLLLSININSVELCQVSDPTFRFSGTDIIIKLTKNNGNQQYSITQNGKILQTVTLDNAFSDNLQMKFDQSNSKILTLIGRNGITTEIELITRKNGVSVIDVRRNLKRGQISQDCFNLDIGQKNWYGGPQRHYQYWPIEKLTFNNYSYVTKEEDMCAVAERYWLNSNGVFIFIDDDVPLFLNQNTNGYENKLCFHANKVLPYNIEDDNFRLNYKIGLTSDIRQAHSYVINNFLHKPTGHPDETMVKNPIWSTWALYKTDVNEQVIRDFASKIKDNGFTSSQIEIDDNWETCYGSLQFDTNKFPDIKKLITDLKEQNFRVTLWIHPFVNKDCKEPYNEGIEKGYFAKDPSGKIDTKWWNTKEENEYAAYIDFTNLNAAKWFSDRLKELQQNTGIDSFKFDAGESSWSPMNSIQTGNKKSQPNQITTAYINTVSQFGKMVEARVGYKTQNYPIFVRMIDKDTEWNWNNGLTTLITTLFQLNFAGYPFVLPDMIGGNGYNHPPDKNIFIRWLQANVFMPSLQFSYVPWEFDAETIEISKKYVQLHSDITEYIIARFKLAEETGEPVNRPIWWLDPNDIVARQIYDEFLLGDKYLSAPVIMPNQIERDIYLPIGKWKDGNNNEIHVGPKWLMSYKAELNVLPYFIKQD